MLKPDTAQKVKAFASAWNLGPLPVGIAILLLGASLIALVASILVVSHLQEKTLKKPPETTGLKISFGRPLGLKLYFGLQMAAMTFTAMLAAWKPWLWGAVIILLIGAGRLNAALTRAKESAKYEEIMQKTALFIALWGIAIWLVLTVG